MYVLVGLEFHPGCNNSPFRVESVPELLTFVSLIPPKAKTALSIEQSISTSCFKLFIVTLPVKSIQGTTESTSSLCRVPTADFFITCITLLWWVSESTVQSRTVRIEQPRLNANAISGASNSVWGGGGHKKFPKGPPFAYVFWKNFQGSPLCLCFLKKFKKKFIKGGSTGYFSPLIWRAMARCPPPPPPLNTPLHAITIIFHRSRRKPCREKGIIPLIDK